MPAEVANLHGIGMHASLFMVRKYILLAHSPLLRLYNAEIEDSQLAEARNSLTAMTRTKKN